MPKVSKVWQHFTLCDQGKRAKCNLCSANLQYDGSSTSNLLKHARGMHGVDKNKGNQFNAVTENVLTNFVTVGRPCNETRKIKINHLVCDVIVENNIPFRLVESDSFRALLSYLEPNYKHMCAETAKNNITKQAADLKIAIINKFEHCPFIALTTDCWTSINNDSFMAITASTIDESWKLISPVLETRFLSERHMAEYLTTEITEAMKQWNIFEKVVAIVHDNASNIKNIAKSAGSNNSMIDIGCAAHTLQLCINDAMGTNKVGNNPISKAVNAANRLVAHFNHSTLASNELLKRQTMMGITEVINDEDDAIQTQNKALKVIQSVRTRWNSIYDMFERLMKLRWPIIAVLGDSNVTKSSDAKTLDLTSENWTLIEQILPILKKLKIANNILCGENYVSLSSVLPVIKMLYDVHMSECESDSVVIQTFKKKVKENLRAKFSLNNIDVNYLIASVLDPRYKHLEFLSDTEKSIAFSKLSDLLNASNLDINNKMPSTSFSINVAVASEEDSFFFIRTKPTGDVLPHEENEIERYKKINDAERNECPLKWWSMQAKNFPNIAKMARKYLCIPATSVASERHFSAAGRTLTKVRNKLLPQTTDVLLFVNRNQNLLKES